jgi:hypothetical protein
MCKEFDQMATKELAVASQQRTVTYFTREIFDQK